MRDLKIVNGDLSFIDYGILLVEGDLELAQKCIHDLINTTRRI